MTLGDLVGTYGDTESIQIMDSIFNTEAEYFYLSAEATGTEAGWFEDDFETSANDVVIPQGSAIMFSSLGSANVQFAGAVPASSVDVVTLDDGFTMVGNPMPVDVKLGDILFTGIGDTDSIQIMDAIGATEHEYFYLSAEATGTDAGWFEDDFATPADDVVIPAGSGFLFSAVNGAAVTVTFASPIK